MTPAGGTGGHSWDGKREGGYEDPRGVLLSVDQLVMAAGESVRRLRHAQWVSRSLGEDWTDDGAWGDMAAQLDEVRGRLTRLRDQVRQAGASTRGDAREPGPDPGE